MICEKRQCRFFETGCLIETKPFFKVNVKGDSEQMKQGISHRRQRVVIICLWDGGVGEEFLSSQNETANIDKKFLINNNILSFLFNLLTEQKKVI